MKEVKITYEERWQMHHWKSICSAYRRSPYFEFYESDLEGFWKNYQPKYLIDFNAKLLEAVLDKLTLQRILEETDGYTGQVATFEHRPSAELAEDDIAKFKPYEQVFGDRLGFHPNLSIIDLLFNKGPEASSFL